MVLDSSYFWRIKSGSYGVGFCKQMGNFIVTYTMWRMTLERIERTSEQEKTDV